MKKDTIKAGLDGLLQVPKQSVNKPQEEPKKRAYKTVCYSIDPELIDRMAYVAHWDRKKIGEVVEEAFIKYLNDWEPTTEEYNPDAWIKSRRSE